MPATWPAFQSGLTAYLTSRSAKKEADTAKKIASLYHASVKTAMPILVPGAMLTVASPKPIESGFTASFKLGKALGGVPSNPGIWMPAAACVVTYWTGKIFSPVPPPTWISGVNNVLVPGVPPAAQIFSAMKAQTAAGVAAGWARGAGAWWARGQATRLAWLGPTRRRLGGTVGPTHHHPGEK